MKIQFLGTGAAEGVPAMFCSCDICKNIRALGKSEFRTRSQVLIDGELSVDFPPESFAHSLEYGVNLSALKYILATHSHMDHFYAHDFILRGYKYAKVENTLEIYGNGEVKKVFDECTRRELKPEVAKNISLNVIKPFSVFSMGEYKVIAIPANHGTAEDCLLYYIEKNGKGYLHLYDTSIVSDEALKFLSDNGAKANLVAFDCTFVEKTGGAGARHMGIEDNMLLKQKLSALGITDEDTKLVITHFSHNGNPTRAHLSKLEEKYSVTAVYDGYQTEI